MEFHGYSQCGCWYFVFHCLQKSIRFSTLKNKLYAFFLLVFLRSNYRHWWHAHFENQYIDGLVGAIIIHEPPETDPFLHAYDEERTIVISDWYHQPTGPLLAHYLSPESKGMEPVPNNGLINGKHTFNCANVIPADLKCEKGERTVFHFLPNRRYRLRIINTGYSSISAAIFVRCWLGFRNELTSSRCECHRAAAPFLFSVDQHQLQVIEADGTNLNPILVDSVPINTGQRYSVILTTNQEPKNYWMRAEFGLACLPEPTNLDPVILAEIRYQGAGAAEPTSVGRFVPDPTSNKSQDNPAFIEACKDLDLFQLHPLQPVPILEPISKSIQVRISFKKNENDNITRGYLNDITYAANPWNPTMMQNLKENAQYDVAQHVMTIDKRDSIVQIILNNSGGQHPFHLHGHVFQVVAQGEGPYEEGKSQLSAVNPLRRDTATVPYKGHTVIRFKADNPGVWALHCHIEWHVTVGLVMQFVELPDELRAMHIPRQVAQLCDTAPPAGFKAHTGFMPPN